jgi:penicillin V acylase-like amidase (Ntn superfamily)
MFKLTQSPNRMTIVMIAAIGGVLLSIALLPPPIEACNALLLNTSGQPGAVVAYGRDMQLDSDMETKAIWVPARTVVPFAPICETCTFTNFSVRYGFVGMLAYPEFTSGVCESFGLSNCIFTLNEGMNTAGLGVSVLWDTTVKTYANYTLPQDVKPRKGVAASDLIAFLLGSCATIKDVKAILTTVNVTNLVLPEPLNSLVIQVRVLLPPSPLSPH